MLASHNKSIKRNKYRVWAPPTEACMCCNKTRQIYVKNDENKLVKVKNPDIQLVNLGINRALYLIDRYCVIVNRKSKVCINCLSMFSWLLQKKIWNKEPNYVWKYTDKDKIYSNKAIIAGYISSNKIWTSFNVKKIKMNAVKQLIYDLKDHPNKVPINIIKYKQLTGLTKSEFSKVSSELIKLIKKKSIKNTGHCYFKDLRTNKVWFYTPGTKKGIKMILRDLIRLFIKWKTNAYNITLAALTECQELQFAESIRKISTVLELYSKKWLVNTREKLKKYKVKEYYNLMSLSEDIDIIIGDGVRFKCNRPKNYHLSHFTFDNKHKHNSYNAIGFCCITGHYIGFYPKKGLGSDGHHPDGYANDFIFINDIDNIITDVVTPNSFPGSNDGTRVLFDRALRMGSFLYYMNLINYGHPNLKLGRQKPKDANDTRKNCTTYRWLIEKSFGNLGQKWKIFRASTTGLNGYYFPLFGAWLDFAGAVCNHLGIGISKVNSDRIKQVRWMKNNEIQRKWMPYEKNKLQKLLDLFRLNSSLSRIWYVAQTPEMLYVNSHWTEEALVNTFCLSEPDMKLYGGGVYARENADYYLIHSRNWINVYYSKVAAYSNLLMIRGIKKRMTRFWEDKKGKNPKRDDYAMHNVLLTKRDIPVINVWKNENYSDKLKYLDSCCDCVIGARDICKDSHVIASILYLKKWVNREQLPEKLKSEHKYKYLYDINHFKRKLTGLMGIQKIYFANKWAANIKQKLNRR